MEYNEKIIKKYFRYIEKGDIENLIKLIENYKIDINKVKTNKGNTGLMYAVYFKHKDIIKYLMQIGADLTLVNCENKNVFDICNGDVEIKKLLEKRQFFYYL